MNIFNALSTLALLIAAMAGNPAACAMELARSGKATATIVVAPDASPAQRHAASELSRFLGEVTGGSFDISSARVVNGVNILIGPSAAGLTDPLGEEEIVIRTRENELIIAGGEPRGTLYAVYTFLEAYVGCHWWSSTASTIPKKSTLSIGKIDVRYSPPFEYRDTNYLDTQDADYSVRNKLNGHTHRLFIDDGFHNVQPDAPRGGRKYAYVKSDKWSAHTFWTLLPPEIYFKDHPDWYSLIDGVRTTELHKSSLCLSNAEGRAQLIENAKLIMRWSPQATIFSVSQVDGLGRCQCRECSRIAEEEGSYSGPILRYVNAVAEQMATVTHAPIDTLAYHYTRKPPRLTKPRDNVIIRFVAAYGATPEDGEICTARPITDARNRPVMEDLLGWTKISPRVYVWEYVGNSTHPFLPHPNLRVIGPDLRFYARNRIKGVFGEAHATTRGTEIAELRAWLLAQLMWNPSRDENELIELFTEGYYGPAGKHVRAYLDVMHDSVENTHGWDSPDSSYISEFMTFEALTAGWDHLKNGADTVRENPELLARIETVQQPVLFAFLMRWDEFRQNSREAGIEWPLPDDSNTAAETFFRIARQNNVNPTVLDSLTMSEPMKAAIRRINSH